jgi:hypothetical protein
MTTVVPLVGRATASRNLSKRASSSGVSSGRTKADCYCTGGFFAGGFFFGAIFFGAAFFFGAASGFAATGFFNDFLAAFLADFFAIFFIALAYRRGVPLVMVTRTQPFRMWPHLAE